MGLAPSELRTMSPKELGHWYNANRPKKYYGNLSEDDAKAISDRWAENPDKYA